MAATVEVQEVLVVREMTLVPGDIVFVYNGVVVGKRGDASEKVAVKQKPPVPQLPPMKARRGRHPGVADITHDMVTDALFKMGAADMLSIADRLGIARNNHDVRAKIGRVVRRLAHLQVIRIVPDDERVRNHIYTLVDVNGYKPSAQHQI